MHTSKPISERTLLSISWPILFELLMLFMIPMVDAYYMSRISTEAVAAVSAVLPLTGIGFILFLPLTQAASSVAAQHLGACHDRMAGVTFSLILLINLFLGLLVSGGFFLLSDQLPGWVGLEGNLAAIATQYLDVIGLGYIFLALRIGTSGILNAQGHTQFNMISAVVMNLINLAGNHLLVTGWGPFPEWGVQGIATASVLAWSSALLMGAWLCRRSLLLPWSSDIPQARVQETVRYILRNGLPSMLEPLCWQLSQVAITKILVQLGVLAISTKAFVANISLFALIWSSAFATGTQIKLAHLLGARDFGAADRQLREGLWLAILGCSVLSLLLAFGAETFLGIFSQDPEVLRLGSYLLWIGVLLESGRALNILVGAALRASGDARFVAMIALLSMWLLAVFGAYALGILAGWGLLGIWLAMSLDEHLRGWLSFHRWRRGHWQTRILYASTTRERSHGSDSLG
jgi:putative MATE family efflux protein